MIAWLGPAAMCCPTWSSTSRVPGSETQLTTSLFFSTAYSLYLCIIHTYIHIYIYTYIPEGSGGHKNVSAGRGCKILAALKLRPLALMLKSHSWLCRIQFRASRQTLQTFLCMLMLASPLGLTGCEKLQRKPVLTLIFFRKKCQVRSDLVSLQGSQHGQLTAHSAVQLADVSDHIFIELH